MILTREPTTERWWEKQVFEKSGERPHDIFDPEIGILEKLAFVRPGFNLYHMNDVKRKENGT